MAAPSLSAIGSRYFLKFSAELEGAAAGDDDPRRGQLRPRRLGDRRADE